VWMEQYRAQHPEVDEPESDPIDDL
jgi:hypothetical protein